MALENLAEVPRILIANLIGDLANSQQRAAKQPFRFLESPAAQMFEKRFPGLLLELLAQVVRAEANMLGHIGQLYAFLEMSFDERKRFFYGERRPCPERADPFRKLAQTFFQPELNVLPGGQK